MVGDYEIRQRIAIARMRTGDSIFIYSCCAAKSHSTHGNLSRYSMLCQHFSVFEWKKKWSLQNFFVAKKCQRTKIHLARKIPQPLHEMLQHQTRKLVYIYINFHVFLYRAAIKTWRLDLLIQPCARVWVCVCAHIVGWWSLPCRPDAVVYRSQFNRNVSHITFYTIRLSNERRTQESGMEHWQERAQSAKKRKNKIALR